MEYSNDNVNKNKSLPFTGFQKILEIICAAGIIFLVVIVMLMWGYIPDKIPSHYNAAGLPDAYGGKGVALILPIIGTILYSMLTALEFILGLWSLPVRASHDNTVPLRILTRTLLSVIKLVVVFAFNYINLCLIFGFQLGRYFLPLFLVFMFLPIVLYIIKYFEYK